MTSHELAALAAYTVHYCGGYVYSGSRWSRGLKNKHRFASGKDVIDPHAVEDNEAILASLPLGSAVHEVYRMGDNESEAVYLKTGSDRWEAVGSTDRILLVRYSRPDTEDPAEAGEFRFWETLSQLEEGNLLYGPARIGQCECGHGHTAAFDFEPMSPRSTCADALKVVSQDDFEEYRRIGWLDNWVPI